MTKTALVSYLLKRAAPVGRLLQASLPEFRAALLRQHGRIPPVDDSYFAWAYQDLMKKDTLKLRQEALKALREMRQSSPHVPQHALDEAGKAFSADPYFLKHLPKLIETKPVSVIHGGHVPGLQGIIRSGPRALLNSPVTGMSGQPERFGIYLFPGQNARLRDAGIYARRAATNWGTEPGILKFKIPEGLLEPGSKSFMMTEGELAIPRSFWQYASQPELLSARGL
jgi:hypothetical protein